MLLTKTNYLLYKQCPQNAWVKIFEPKIYYSYELSDFDKMIMETGNEVDKLARELFPDGILIDDRKDNKITAELIAKKEKIIYQPVFFTEKFEAIADILVWNDEYNAYDIYEVKSTNSGENKKKRLEEYKYDLAFQFNVLNKLSIPINNTFIVRLNCDYIRQKELNVKELFDIVNLTDEVKSISEAVLEEMDNIHSVLKIENKPTDCSCIVKGKNSHCTTFSYLNPTVPEYSVHSISRIGSSKKKLAELIDLGIYSIYDVPEDFPLSDIQRNQVNVAQSKKIIIDKNELNKFLETIEYPISFIDYETFPSAIPRYIGYKPYNQIPFQFSLHVLEKEDSELKHFEFLHTENSIPDIHFIKEIEKVLPKTGSIIVWNKTFECAIVNDKIAERNNEYSLFIKNFNDRVIDLEVPFKKQFYIHPDFMGKTSIKYILPTLSPEFSYKTLNIQEGGTASETWNKIVSGNFDEHEIKEKSADLLAYCKLDTLAMFEIWKKCLE